MKEPIGYAITDFDGTGMLEIQRTDGELIFPDDEAAVEQAIKDGVKIIPVEELPADFPRRYLGWVDTPENRERIRAYCELKSFTISPAGMNRWIEENRAEHTGDFVEGVLLDNFVLSCEWGYAAVYEVHLNEWSSIYRVEYETGEAKDVWKRWHEFEARSKDTEE